MNSSSFVFDAYIVTLIIGALLALVASLTAWKRRDAPGAIALLVLTVASAWWIFCHLLSTLGSKSSDSLIWYRLLFAGVVLTVPAFLTFALQYTNRGHLVTRRILIMLAIEPILFNIAVWTDPFHGLVFAGWQGPESGKFIGGSLFWVHSAYSYVLAGLTQLVLIQGFLRSPPLYRRQSGIVIVGSWIPLVGNALTIFHLSPFPDKDLTPLGLVVSSVLISTSLFRRGLLDLVPVARDAVVERMNDGVLVLDIQNRVVDLNPAARAILGVENADVLGKPVDIAMPVWRTFSSDQIDLDDFHREALISDNRYIDLRITRLKNQRNNLNGRLLVFRDITPLKQASAALYEANHLLRKQLAEIEEMQVLLKEQAIRDGLTGLYNRRFLEEMLARELSQSERTHQPVSVVMIDLDYFKRINDKHGHLAGDKFLQGIGDLLRLRCRSGDAACRFGGEEFVVVLHGTSIETARQRAEEWRQAFMKIRIPYAGLQLTATFSAGVASFPIHGEDTSALMKAADIALYAAKATGRNRVVCAEIDDAD